MRITPVTEHFNDTAIRIGDYQCLERLWLYHNKPLMNELHRWSPYEDAMKIIHCLQAVTPTIVV